MIARIAGKLIEKKNQSLIINVNGVFYEVFVPASVFERIEETLDPEGHVHLITYHYFQIAPGSGMPVLVGFINEVERDFFLQFIKVSGIGPKAAVKALNKPISEVTRAIDEGDLKYLQTLPGIGSQRAKEIIAKLQGKVGRFGLIQDKAASSKPLKVSTDWQEEALAVLVQLQYKKPEAIEMISQALKRNSAIETTEELLNEIYKLRIRK